MTVTLTYRHIIDMIMAADGISASLDRTDGTLTVLCDDHAEGLKQLIRQAMALIALRVVEAITDYSDDADGITVEVIDSVGTQQVAASQLTAALVWQTLHLAYAGSDNTRAAIYAATAGTAIAALSAHTTPCPARRHPDWIL